MERLTFEGNFCDIAMCDAEPEICGGSCSQRETWERLKQYEDLEAEGRLVVLPCKVGETVYEIRVCSCWLDYHDQIRSGRERCRNKTNIPGRSGRKRKTRCLYAAECKFSVDMVLDIGKTVFLTREEAEAALKGEGNG